MPASKPDTKVKNSTPVLDGFRVALNPRNPEANSWYNPATGVNLSLSNKNSLDEIVEGTGPISGDLSGATDQELEPILNGIRHGILLIAAGDMPDGLKKEEINSFAAPRSRWDPDLADLQALVLKHHDSLIRKKTEDK